MRERDLRLVENNILMRIEHQARNALQLPLPVRQAQKAVREHDERLDPVLPHDLHGAGCPGQHVRLKQPRHARLVDEPVEGEHVLVARLREEGRELGVQVEGSLGVEGAVGAVEPADDALAAAVVPAVLAAGEGVQVEVHAEAVLAGPLDAAQEVAPGDFGDVGVAGVGGDGPVGVGDADVVEAGGADVGEGLLGHEGGVVGFEGLGGLGGAQVLG